AERASRLGDIGALDQDEAMPAGKLGRLVRRDRRLKPEHLGAEWQNMVGDDCGMLLRPPVDVDDIHRRGTTVDSPEDEETGLTIVPGRQRVVRAGIARS